MGVPVVSVVVAVRVVVLVIRMVVSVCMLGAVFVLVRMLVLVMVVLVGVVRAVFMDVVVLVLVGMGVSHCVPPSRLVGVESSPHGVQVPRTPREERGRVLLAKIGEALALSLGMMWQVAWSLILGFALSAAVQALVSKARMQALLGRDGFREIALATGFGAASSSCSYAAAAMSKTLFKKGAALVPSMAFLFSSTNLVLELGIILWLLMGWQFTLAEWIGGLLLIAVMTLLVKLTYPKELVEEARRHVDEATGHEHGSMEGEGASVLERLRSPATRIAIARNFSMDLSMLWKDLLGGFLIAGFLAAFVPDRAWKALFFSSAPPGVRLIENALAGPVIAIFSFVCSIGNVPMAAILWASGISFGGVIAFLYADLIVLPLLDIYRKYYGVRMMLYMFAIFFTTMVTSAVLMDLLFSALGMVPHPNPDLRAELSAFSLNYTFWLNLSLGALGVYLWVLSARHPMNHGCHGHDDHDQHDLHPSASAQPILAEEGP